MKKRKTKKKKLKLKLTRKLAGKPSVKSKQKKVKRRGPIVIKFRNILFLSFLLMALFVFIVAFSGFNGVHQIEDAFDDVVTDATPVLIDLISLKSFSIDIRLEIIDFILTGDESHRKELDVVLNSYERSLDDLILREGPEGGKWTELIDSLNGYMDESKNLFVKLSSLNEGEILSEAKIITSSQFNELKELERLEQELSPILDERIEYEKNELREQQDSVVKTINSVLVTLVIYGILVLFLAVVLSFLVSAFILRPIKFLVNDLEKISLGELDVQFIDSNVYEIQELLTALNRIIVSLKLAVKKVGVKKEELGMNAKLRSRLKNEKMEKLEQLKEKNGKFKEDK